MKVYQLNSKPTKLTGFTSTMTWWGLVWLFWPVIAFDYWNDYNPDNRRAWRHIFLAALDDTFGGLIQ